MAESYPNGFKNTLGKGEIARFKQFSPFLRVFSNDSFSQSVFK